MFVISASVVGYFIGIAVYGTVIKSLSFYGTPLQLLQMCVSTPLQLSAHPDAAGSARTDARTRARAHTHTRACAHTHTSPLRHSAGFAAASARHRVLHSVGMHGQAWPL